ncbi:response regulator [Fundidesulfovibrio putealis]|uniref:response regulator n=1 Tax=Fundidesulfovibrio putealis TaxID=270496 RepID=UPI000686691C|nr:response regulator [Fundidesulfovibrio putealis]
MNALEERRVSTCTILLVDDEAEFIETLGKRLTRRGLGVLLANSGQEALDLIAVSEIDVVVLDVKMPGMDGIEALQKIKALKPDLEVLMLTAHANVEVAMRGMELGAFDYLMKPVELDDLLYKIQDANKKKCLTG